MQQNWANLTAGVYKPYAYEAITVADTAIGFTSSNYMNSNASEVRASRAVCTLETAQVRYRYDGGTPTDAVGHVLNANDVVVIMGDDAIKNFKAIRTGGTSGSLKVTYEQ